jgi:DNA replication protein DnaC
VISRWRSGGSVSHTAAATSLSLNPKFLHDLLATEVAASEQRRLDGRMRFSRLPAHKTLEQFDFTAQPTLDRRLVEDLATLRFVEEKANCLLIGPPDLVSHCTSVVTR